MTAMAFFFGVFPNFTSLFRAPRNAHDIVSIEWTAEDQTKNQILRPVKIQNLLVVSLSTSHSLTSNHEPLTDGRWLWKYF